MPIHRLGSICFLLLMLLLPMSRAHAQAGRAREVVEKTLFRLRLKPKQTFTHQMRTVQITRQMQEGTPVEIKITMAYTWRYEVLAEDGDKNYLIKLTFSRIQFRKHDPSGNIDLDSRNPTAKQPIQARMFGALIGESLMITVTPEGRVKSIIGAEDLIQTIGESMKIDDAKAKEQMKASARAQFGKTPMKHMIEGILSVLPHRAVYAGERWKVQRDDHHQMMPVGVEQEWHLKQLKPKKAVFTMKGAVSADPKSPGLRQMGMRVKHLYSGTITSKVTIDPETGWVLTSKTTQKMSGKTVMYKDDFPDGKIETKTQIESITTVGPPSDLPEIPEDG
jgi:Family of unknown function (DUF6263)